MTNFFKKYHKWIAIVITVFMLLFAFSGIILNHRDLLSSVDVSRSWMPDEYEIVNWNNAAVKGTQKFSPDSILIYGNIGIWLTDSNFKDFKDFDRGIPEGIDNRKVCKVELRRNGELWAGTLFGLYRYDFDKGLWQRVPVPTQEQRVVDFIDFGDSLYLLTRSHLLVYKGNRFEVRTLPPPEGYDNKIGLFKTLWVIHSGEIYGHIGKLVVDMVGLIFIFLTITGLIIFINKYRIQSRFKKKKPFQNLKSINLWNLKWHNKIGWITIVLLLITASTGIFLRPPLLAFIAEAKVGKIPGTELASPNPWFDQLRRFIYDREKERFIVATYDGLYYSDDFFASDLKNFKLQPPASVMGVNVLKKTGDDEYMVGSFEGLFLWNPERGKVFDYIKKEPYVKKDVSGPPIGEYLVTGYTDDFKGHEVVFDYDKGAFCLDKGVEFTKMPANVKKAYRISLWNFALEIHTGRIYQSFLGIFYVLVVPLVGFALIFVLISGFVVWWKLHKGVKY
jgi:hypothetical protein